MISTLLNILAIALLLWLAVQDFNNRQISVVLLAAVFVLLLIRQIIAKGSIQYTGIVINVSFAVIQLLFVLVYFGLKHKNIRAIEQYIGWGDILFLSLPALVFSPVNFIAYYISSLILTLTGFMVYIVFKGKSKQIPLAGAMALCLVLCLLLPANKCYDDSLLTDLILKITG